MSKNSNKAVIIEGFRTPFVKTGQDLQDMSAEELGIKVLKELLERTQIDFNEIEEVILSNIVNSLDHFNLTSVITMKVGLPQHVFAWQFNHSCLENICNAAIKIQSGLVRTLLIGGVESMSQALVAPSPGLTKIIKKVIQSKTWKNKLKPILSLRPKDIKLQFTDQNLFFPLTSGGNAGQKAEELSEHFHISRKEQDEFTLMSFQKACQAQKKEIWKEEIVPVFPPPDFELLTKDPYLGNIPTLHFLSELKPCFNEDHGTVTEGNSSFPADGAAALLMTNEEKAKTLGYKPLVYIDSFSRVNADFREYNQGLLYAVEQALKQAQLQIKNIDLFEMDESFSVQALACLKSFRASKYIGNPSEKNFALEELDPKKCNVNGGALAIGHPLSATPIRMVLSLAKEMNRRQVEWGMVIYGACPGPSEVLILKNILN
ncbi:MAG: thiolase family protein [Bdellovibrionales bacterium]|nr:thiolase family protein [Bdellovibrionales bacterium]